MTILEENVKWHLEAFASELFIYLRQTMHTSVNNIAKYFLIKTAVYQRESEKRSSYRHKHATNPINVREMFFPIILIMLCGKF